MQLDSAQQTGDLGEQRVATAFVEIGWAQPVKVPRDLGDDFITFGRTSVPKVPSSKSILDDSTDKFDLSAPVLIQVKSSKTQYNRAKSSHEGRKGWWFYETTTDHFDHWLRFDLPYLLVLHDEPSKRSYWAHVHRKAIDSTAMRRRIFVPEDQPLDERAVAALNRVAVSVRSPEFAHLYTASAGLTPGQRIRHALITPTLVTSRLDMPNKVTYDQVVAMLMLDQRDMISYAVHTGSCPRPESWRTHRSWGWRFAQALWEVLNGTEPTALKTLAKNAPSKYERDACQVLRGVVALIEQRHTAALNRFMPDRYSKPVDRAWLLTQRAQTFLEVGDTKAAVEAAEAALMCLNAQVGDITVSVIRAAATNVVYSASGDDEDPDRRTAAFRVARAAAEDNLGTLWRAEAISRALANDLSSRFRTWSGKRTRTFGATNPSTAHTKLTAAAWNAALSAAWDDWRGVTRQAAKTAFITSVDHDDVNDALTALTRAASKEDAKEAATRIWLNGPVEALKDNVVTLSQTTWTPRTEGPAMEILAAAGDLLTPARAEATIDRILKLLRKNSIRHAPGGWADRWSEAARTLPRLLYTAGPAGHEKCAALITTQFGTTETRADSMLGIAQRLRFGSLDDVRKRELIAVAIARSDHYRAMLLELMAPYIPEATTELTLLAKNGDSTAARALLVVGETSPENWRALGRQTAPKVLDMVQKATGDGRTRNFTFGITPHLHDLALSAFHTNNSRHWKVVIDALDAGVLPGEQVDGCINFLASNYHELPSYVQSRLKKVAPAMRAHADEFLEAGAFSAAVLALRFTAGVLNEGETLAGLLEVRHGAGVDFPRLVAHLPTADRDAFMLAGTVDPDPDVRAQAAYGVVRLASDNPRRAKALATALLKSLDLNDGCRMPLGIAAALAEFNVPDFEDVRDELKRHPSSVVRAYVT